MDLHANRSRPVHLQFHLRPRGEEPQQMPALNLRLENYLSRVKLLEAENATLAEEVRSMRGGALGASVRRGALEEELQKAREEVGAAWRDRVRAEMEVGRLAEELRATESFRKEEVRAQEEAWRKVEVSRRELEEEHMAQGRLREKIHQLEQEMRSLVRTHQEDLTRVQARLARSRTSEPSILAQRYRQAPDLLRLGEEITQRTARAWQEKTHTYQGQLARLEETLNRAGVHLAQVDQERSENLLKLQTLEQELLWARDLRGRLEDEAGRRLEEHGQEVHALQEQLEVLEAEKEELGLRLARLLQENRGLLQLKTSLGLEVANYRALLDGGGLGCGVSISNLTRTSPWPDVLRAPLARRGVISVSGTTRRTFVEPPRVVRGREGEEGDPEEPYPKILQEGAVEHFRPQEVNEKVTYAEPLSPPNEEELLNGEMDGQEEGGVEEGASGPPGRREDTSQSRAPLAERHPEGSRRMEEVRRSSAGPEEDVPQRERGGEVEELRLETSRSEEKEPLEPGGQSSEGEEEEEEHGLRSDLETSRGGEKVEEDRLYPDGEEMDTWDSVMERKADVRTDGGAAEEGPEEDISPGKARGGGSDVAGGEYAGPPREEDQEDEEDSQNVSVSWRTELEGDSYALENTLADTRPLIRYASDGQAEESESSDGEAGGAAWSHGRSRRFGTMEDLCEDVEDDLERGGDTRLLLGKEGPGRGGGADQKVAQGPPEREVENFYDEELERDRLVEEELENLSLDSFSSHFEHLQARLPPHGRHPEEEGKEDEEEEEAGRTSSSEEKPDPPSEAWVPPEDEEEDETEDHGFASEMLSAEEIDLSRASLPTDQEEAGDEDDSRSPGAPEAATREVVEKTGRNQEEPGSWATGEAASQETFPEDTRLSGFGEGLLVWGGSGDTSPNISGSEVVRPNEGGGKTKEYKEVTQMSGRGEEGGRGHSEESEGESWSSGGEEEEKV